jgi:hypothetical protein
MPGISTALTAFSYNAQATTGLVSISTSASTDTIETTRIGDARRTFTVGQGTTTISGEIYYDQGDTCSAVMETDAQAPTSRAFVCTYSTGMTMSGNCFITSWQVTASSNDTIRASFELQTTGTVTIA